MKPSPLGLGAFAVALGTAGVVAFAFGGSRDVRTTPQRLADAGREASTSPGGPGAALSGSAGSASSVRATAAEAEEVELRLTHALQDSHARIDVPSLARAEGMLAAHWRRMQLAWISPGTEPLARRVTTNIALRTSIDEKQWSMPKKDGTAWAPDARVWNMNEGSYDQRESLFAPTPSQFGFHVTVPNAARLTFAAAVVQKTREPTTFTVAVAEGDNEKEVCTVHVTEPQQWLDTSCDLGPFAGKSVELRLRTSGAMETPGLALWGNPTILARRRTEVPLNVLFIVVDALRPDVIASFHDDEHDARVRAAPVAPLDALLPKVPGLTPSLDELSKNGVRFTHASSGGAWTRPGTLAMLGGALSSQLGLDALPWVLPDPSVRAYYQSDPPLLPLLMRRAHVTTRAFVNNYFMVGYAAVGVDMGFERVDDHRFRTRDTMEITDSATKWLRDNKDERFFAFVNFNSPHEPWEPPDRFLGRLAPVCNAKAPQDPCGPSEDTPRKYMAEAAKDDEAIGVLIKTLGELGLRERTLVVVTADHGETLSAAHAGRSKLDDLQVRFHHAVSNYEETTRVPILLSLPGVLPTDLAIKSRVSTIDLAPTILDILGMSANTKMTGRSLVSLIKSGGKNEEGFVDRALVSEGRGTRGIVYGHHRLLVREGGARVTTIGTGSNAETVTTSEELYDLDADPGERKNLASSDPHLVAEMRARLEAVLKNVVTADASMKTAGGTPSGAQAGADGGAGDSGLVQMRFAGAGKVHRVTGTVTADGGTLSGTPFGACEVMASAGKAEITLTTDPDHVVGLDLKVDPPTAVVHWEFFMDERPLARDHVYGGTFGLAEPALERGLVSERARNAARAWSVPEIDPARDLGLFVTKRGGADEIGPSDATAPERATNGAAASEMNRMLREWGYANRSSSTSSTTGASDRHSSTSPKH